ncbi:MAG: alpha-ketoacid dehydrogenase subunit beta [Actinomycetota bacterium]|nr:alpha-ketoacid dehydrogenase subunit beta [Actinomycetota bacterium]
MKREITYKEAISEGLAISMRTDEDVVILGEDLVGGVGKEDDSLLDAWGGPFTVTKGFIKEFGPERIFDTPISENAFIGASIGASMIGLRPVAELMYGDFMGVCFDNFLNQAAKQRYMFGGAQKNPITIRTTYGCGWREGAHHSHVNYSLITHIPGWYVVAPSTPYDMKGCLISAIRNDNPVFVFEHRLLYDKKGAVPEGDYELEIGKGEVKKTGKDITVVAIGGMVSMAVNVASKLENENISVEVVDPIWLAPLDEELILKSVEKTGNLLVIDEDNPRCSVATDIITLVAEKGLDYIVSKIRRLNCPNTPVPFSPALEDEYMITEKKIEEAIKDVIK